MTEPLRNMSEVQLGPCRMILGDCLEILPTLPPVDAVITDPPYGIGEAAKNHKSRNKLTGSPNYTRSEWDNLPAADDAIELILRTGKLQVIFGGNYFKLPPSTCWLVWDKLNGDNDFADCELAWTNAPVAVRLIRHMWAGMLRDSERDTPRVHPTQKPVAVMSWAMDKIKLQVPSTVCDPFMGSGTTGIACIRTGRQFIGIEKDPAHFKTACERIARELQQQTLAL
jgi:DNA modification methylase